MMKCLEQFASKCAERTVGTRFVETRYDANTGIVEFNVCIVTDGEPNKRVFGGGTFEKKDLQRIAAELGDLAHDFALCDAHAEQATVPAKEDSKNGN